MKEAITFPELSASTNARPAACPRCGQPGMQRHQKLTRPVVDLKLTEVQVVQYQCSDPQCGASLTITPPGLQPGCKHSDRTKVMSVVLWGLGLSFRDAAAVLKGLGVPISHVEIILNVREMGAAAMARQQKASARIKAPVLGADETQVKLSGNGVTLGFLTDPSTGEIVGMELLASREGEELGRWLVEAAKHFGAKVLVSDELESYKPAAEKAGLEHQLCLAHWRKAVARRLKKIEGYPEEKKLIREALRQLDDKGLAAIRWLHQQFRGARPPRKGQHQSPEYALSASGGLTLDIIENWNRLVCYQQTHEPMRDNLGRQVRRRYQVPSTNPPEADYRERHRPRGQDPGEENARLQARRHRPADHVSAGCSFGSAGRGAVPNPNPLTYHHGVTVSLALLTPTRPLRPLPPSFTNY